MPGEPTVSARGTAPAPPLFPLPLTPIERYFMMEHARSFPAHSLSLYDFEGELDRGALEAALPEALARHPLLVARVDPSRRSWLDPAGTALPPIEWCGPGDGAVAARCPARLDLVREPGVRLRVEVRAGGFRVAIENHHAVSDGVGKLQFVADWMLAYAARVRGGRAPEWIPAALARLRERARLDPPAPLPGSAPRERAAWRDVLDDVLAYLRIAPEPLRGEAPVPIEGSPASGLVVRDLDRATVQGLARRAKEAGATFNDLVVAATLGVMADWNLARGAAQGSWVQVAVPNNYRTPEDAGAPAANRVGLDFRERQVGACRELPPLLAAVAADSRRCRELGSATILPTMMAYAFWIPGLVEFYTRLHPSTPTGVVSNLGRVEPLLESRGTRGLLPLAEAGCRFSGVTFSSPLREGTRVSLGLATVAGATRLAASFDRRHFPEPLREEFMDRLAARLAEAAGTMGRRAGSEL